MQKPPLIGVVMATLMEAKPFFTELPLEKIGDPFFPVFSNPEIVLIISGIGKSNAAMATFHLCQTYSPGVIVNAGAAGAAYVGFSLGDIFQINRIVEYDRPDFKTGAPHIYAPDLLNGLKTEGVATQDKPVISPDNRERVSMHARLVDMEAAAVAHAVGKFRKPFFCFKFVTDTPEHHEEENIIKYIKIFRQPFYQFFMTAAMPRLLTIR